MNSSTEKSSYSKPLIWAGLIPLIAAFTYSYWPTMVELQQAWETEPDYSHGYLVVPLCLMFLYMKRDSFPGFQPGFYLGGILMLAVSVAIRIFGVTFFVSPADGWSIVFWAMGCVWLLAGFRVLWWASPSLLFLFFMIPLPYRLERGLSGPLQSMATDISCWVLQLLGQPAMAVGNVIQLGEHTLFVKEACSGMRIFVGILALAFAYVISVRRTWWERGLLLLSALPIALIANSTRIVVTGLLYQYTNEEFAGKFGHDWAGYFMIPFAALLFAGTLWYMTKLIRRHEQLNVRSSVGRRQVAGEAS